MDKGEKKFCVNCGKQIEVNVEYCPYCGTKQGSTASTNKVSNKAVATIKRMPVGIKTTKLVVGILMIVLSIFIFMQSTMVGIGDAMSNNGHQSGSQGIFVFILFLAAGIVYISTRKSFKMGADIANLVLMVLSCLIAFGDVGVFTDLEIYGWMSLIIGVGFFVWHLLINRNMKK